MFCCEIDLVYPVHVSNEKFEDCMNLLLIADENKSHCVYVKDFKWRHIPYSFAYRNECFDDRFSKLVVLYRGKKCVQ